MNKLKFYGLGCFLILFCYGCFRAVSVPPTSSSSTSSTVMASENQLSRPVVPDSRLITQRGFGAAQLGITLGELKTQLGSEAEFTVISPLIVDFDGVAVSQNGEILYYILYPSGETLRNFDSIEFLLTQNPNYLTAEGIGVGTSLTQASAVYGEATLSYSTNNESREMVSFTNSPAPNIHFRTTGTPDALAGIYPKSSEDYHQTHQFKPDAAIGGILLRESRRRD